MNKSAAFLLVVAAALGGCAPSKPSVQPTAPQPATTVKLVVLGPNGKLSLGDSLAQAKMAFPAPKGAEVMDASLSFAAVSSGKGWAWQTSDNSRAFEVMLEDGEVAAIAITDGVKPDALFADAARAMGKPTHESVGKLAKAQSWVSGDSACFVFTSNLPGAGVIGCLILGSKSDIALLGYNADDPEPFVRQLDAAETMAKKLRPVFEEAKRKAKAKAEGKAQPDGKPGGK